MTKFEKKLGIAITVLAMIFLLSAWSLTKSLDERIELCSKAGINTLTGCLNYINP